MEHQKNIFQAMFSLLQKLNAGFLVIIILTFVLGWQLGHRDYSVKINNYKPDIKVTNQQPPQNQVDLDFKLFWDTWDMLAQKYIDKTALDPKKLYYGAIQGMVAAVGDPYTVFLPPTEQKTSKEQLSGAFEGVGIQLGYNKDKRLVVIAPLKGTPADKAGVQAGDMILEINEKDTTNLSLPEAVNMIRGPKGSSVTLALFSENDTKPKDVTLMRDTITVKSVEFEKKIAKSGKVIAYIHVSSFGEKTRKEWDEAVSEALTTAPQGVVVDVRNDPGGFLDAAVYLASEFIPDGVVMVQQDAKGNKLQQSVVKEGKLLRLPVVVLINKGSASASEILAGALKDRIKATLIGEQSFGKGTIQSAEDLPGGTGIHITTAKWLTPSEFWVHQVGLTPDIKIEPGQDPKIDVQLDKALEILDSK